ncbi:MAG: hypothetical protein ACREMM_09785 [Gemmatimonadales bacterium]
MARIVGTARVAMFRWRAVGPLLVFGMLGVVTWILLGDRIAERTVESVGTTAIGAKVEIRALHLDVRQARVAVRGLTVASPFEALKNVLEADELVADVDPLPLLEKKVVIDRLAAKGLRFGTARATDGRTGGPSGEVMGQVQRWSAQLEVPALQLATGKISVGRLDPAQLNAARAAAALATRVDSAQRAWNAALAGLDVAATADTAQRMIDRLRGARPTDLKLLGDARRTLGHVQQAHDRLAALERSVNAGVAILQAGVTALNDAKQRDYALARGLLQLPSLDAPDIGAALFGRAAIDRFQRALYWAELGRRYLPPGLLPKPAPGPRRARRSGITVRFPQQRAYPTFLLKTGELSFQLPGRDAAARTYTATLTGLTSDPALYGRPTTLAASAPRMRAAALLDHVRSTPRDTAAATVDGVVIPEFRVPSLPIRLDPGQGTVALSFALAGDSIRGRWSVRSDRVRWTRDTAAAAGSGLPDLVWRVVSGISTLDVAASLSGTRARPSLSVSSNLDRALAEGIRAVVGEELAAAERRVRAQVDSIVERQAGPARAQVASLTSDLTRRLGGQRTQLDDIRKALEQRLQALTRLPGVRLP